MSSLGIFDEHIASLEKMRKKQTSSIKPRDLGDMSERLFHQRVFRAGPQAGQADLDRDCLKVCLGSWVVTEFLILMGFAVPYFNTLCVAHCLKADHAIYFFSLVASKPSLRTQLLDGGLRLGPLRQEPRSSEERNRAVPLHRVSCLLSLNLLCTPPETL